MRVAAFATTLHVGKLLCILQIVKCVAVKRKQTSKPLGGCQVSAKFLETPRNSGNG